MPPPPLPPLGPKGAIAADALGWLRAYLRFAGSVWGQAPGVVATALARTARDAGRDLAQANGAGAIVAGLWRNYLDGLSQLAGTVATAAESAVAARPATPPTLAYQVPAYQVMGKPFLLPARVADASQGWALYFVGAEIARKHLGAAAKDFDVVDAGNGRTPVAILGVDYRASDFGAYPELVFSVLVQPKGERMAMPLVHYLAIIVSQPFTQEAARVVWGLEKTLVPTCRAIYSPDEVRFEAAPGALSVTFPRFGDRRSATLPIHQLSFRDGIAMRAVSMRAGADEGMQIGGSVRLTLGDPRAGNCLCRDGGQDCLCDTLREFDIEGYLPAANGWTGTMTGDFGPPVAVTRSGTSG